MLIDTHAHVSFVAFKDDGDEVTERALKENIWMINIGSERNTSRRALEYAKKYPQGVFAAVGLHPIHLRAQQIDARVDEYENIEFKAEAEKFDYDHYKSQAQNPEVVAIGEIGLDYYRIENPKPKSTNPKQIPNPKSQISNQTHLINLQKETLLEQMALAQEINKPVIFHCREAHNDLLATLKEWEMVGNKKLSGVIHSFSGRWSQAQLYLAMGFYLGFNGIITFARDYDKVIKQMPLERLLLETDCPYLTPVPYRGKRNEPLYVKYVAEKVAELRGMNFEDVAETTSANAKKLFNI